MKRFHGVDLSPIIEADFMSSQKPLAANLNLLASFAIIYCHGILVTILET